MKSDNEFDKRMELYKGRIPEDIRDALIDVTDTLDFCWTAAQSVFETQAQPEHALEICKIVLAQRLSNHQK